MLYNRKRMYYLVALGNPGEEYAKTRHNVGWLVLNAVLSTYNFPNLVASAKYQGLVGKGRMSTHDVMVLYPDTFMNASGGAVKKLAIADLSKLIVLHDDIALPLGEIKISVARGDGGHNGLTSIIKELQSNEFIRVRIGIGERNFFTREVKRPAGAKLPKFVLGNFTKKELVAVEEVSTLVTSVLISIMTNGVEAAMNTYN